jgi:hypothetical protein
MGGQNTRPHSLSWTVGKADSIFCTLHPSLLLGRAMRGFCSGLGIRKEKMACLPAVAHDFVPVLLGEAIVSGRCEL